MSMLFDSFGRQITYLRLAVTDRCNLRCTYCMPAEGIDIVNRKELLTYKEMYRIVRVLTELGITKLRLTGGEPFVRKDFIRFLDMLSFNDLLEEIHITTNGTLISEHVEQLQKLSKVKSVNLSIDSLNSENFLRISRRDLFTKVMQALTILEQSDLKLKLNVVVQSGVNTDEINDFVALVKDKDIELRFIEEMPFNGFGKRAVDIPWNYEKIFEEIKRKNPSIQPLPIEKSSTSHLFTIEGSKGIVGIIPAYTRTICSDCNRIRITSKGELKNCLFDEGVYSIRDFIRAGASNEELKQQFIQLVSKKPKDGFQAELSRQKNKLVSESMSTIGG